MTWLRSTRSHSVTNVIYCSLIAPRAAGAERTRTDSTILEGSQASRDRGVSLWPCSTDACPLLLCIHCGAKDKGCWFHRQGGQQTEPVMQQGMRQQIATAIMQPQAPMQNPITVNEAVTLAAIAGAASPMRNAHPPRMTPHTPPVGPPLPMLRIIMGAWQYKSPAPVATRAYLSRRPLTASEAQTTWAGRPNPTASLSFSRRWQERCPCSSAGPTPWKRHRSSCPSRPIPNLRPPPRATSSPSIWTTSTTFLSLLRRGP